MAFATEVKRRRGTKAENDAFTGAEGEITIDLTSKKIRVHDGVTPGGFALALDTETDTDPLGTMYIMDGLLSGAEALDKKLAGEWVEKALFPEFYEKYLAMFQGGTGAVDTVNTRQGSLDTTSPIYTIDFIRGADGRKYVDYSVIANISNIEALFTNGDSAPYYMVDLVNERIRLPRFNAFPRFTANTSTLNAIMLDTVVNFGADIDSVSEQFGDTGAVTAINGVKLIAQKGANSSKNTPTFSGSGNSGRLLINASYGLRTGKQFEPRSVKFVIYFKVASSKFSNIPQNLAEQLEVLTEQYTDLSTKKNFQIKFTKTFGTAVTIANNATRNITNDLLITDISYIKNALASEFTLVGGNLQFPILDKADITLTLRLNGTIGGTAGTAREFAVNLARGDASVVMGDSIIKVQSNTLTSKPVTFETYCDGASDPYVTSGINTPIINTSGQTITLNGFEFLIKVRTS